MKSRSIGAPAAGTLAGGLSGLGTFLMTGSTVGGAAFTVGAAAARALVQPARPSFTTAGFPAAGLLSVRGALARGGATGAGASGVAALGAGALGAADFVLRDAVRAIGTRADSRLGGGGAGAGCATGGFAGAGLGAGGGTGRVSSSS